MKAPLLTKRGNLAKTQLKKDMKRPKSVVNACLITCVYNSQLPALWCKASVFFCNFLKHLEVGTLLGTVFPCRLIHLCAVV